MTIVWESTPPTGGIGRSGVAFVVLFLPMPDPMSAFLLAALALASPQGNVGVADPLPIEVARLQSPDAPGEDGFGLQFDLSGDWLAVSAPFSDLAGPDAGAVYLYLRVARKIWIPHQTITSFTGGVVGDVKISGDTLAVATDTGLRIFTLTGRMWLPTHFLSTPPSTTNYAKAFDLEGDVLAVGTGFWDCAGSTGTLEEVHVHERDAGGPGNWGLVASHSDGYQGGAFGARVALEDDRLLVSTPSIYWPCLGVYDQAHLYGRDIGGPSAWGEEAPLSAAGSSYFGEKLTLSARVALTGGSNVHIFEPDPMGVGGGLGGWPMAATIPASAYGGWLSSIHLAGDRLFIGHRPPSGEGRLFVFERDFGGPGAWQSRATLFPSDTSLGDLFGARIVGDAERLAVSAPGTETVYLFASPPARRGARARLSGATAR